MYEEYKGKSGVYVITNLTNGKVYIGSAVDFFNAWVYRHIRGLNNKTHKNIRLQNAWNKYGKDYFKFEVLEYCELENLIKREQYYLDTVLFAQEYIQSNKEDERFEKLGYNISPTAGNVLGKRCSEQTKIKLSELNKGKPQPKNKYKRTASHLEKISLARKGKKMSPEQVERMRKYLTGIPKSKEHVEKVRQALIGRKVPENQRLKAQQGQLRNYQENPQRRIDRSIAQKKVMATMPKEWHEQKNRRISEANKGKKGKPLTAVNIYSGTFLEFKSLRDAASYFNVLNSVLCNKIKQGKYHQNYLFTYDK
jgi:group I intron endonuclease